MDFVLCVSSSEQLWSILSLSCRSYWRRKNETFISCAPTSSRACSFVCGSNCCARLSAADNSGGGVLGQARDFRRRHGRQQWRLDKAQGQEGTKSRRRPGRCDGPAGDETGGPRRWGPEHGCYGGIRRGCRERVDATSIRDSSRGCLSNLYPKSLLRGIRKGQSARDSDF